MASVKTTTVSVSLVLFVVYFLEGVKPSRLDLQVLIVVVLSHHSYLQRYALQTGMKSKSNQVFSSIIILKSFASNSR